MTYPALPTIGVVIPYFGLWPKWMDFFLISCEANPTIDWFLLGDHQPSHELPPNVKFRSTSWADYKNHISQKLGISFSANNPYKLCDLKPAFGLIHDDFLEGYDFFGFGDVDVIYGNIRHFYTPELLNRHKLISTHYFGVSGHLCLIRNETAWVNAFKRVPGWQSVFEDRENHVFDEWAFSKIFLRGGGQPKLVRWLRNRYDAFHRQAYFKEQHVTPIGYYVEPREHQIPPERYEWSNGKLCSAFGDRTEYIYLHFMNWKANNCLIRDGVRLKAEWPKLDLLIHPPGAKPRLDDTWEIGHDGIRIINR